MELVSLVDDEKLVDEFCPLIEVEDARFPGKEELVVDLRISHGFGGDGREAIAT